MKKKFRVLALLGVAAAALSAAGCSGEDSAKSCIVASDCGDTSLYRCDVGTGTCIEITPAHCLNKVKDGDETDVDCGGSCGTCAKGKSCKLDKECQTGFCDTDGGSKCQERTCETDDECKGFMCYSNVCVSCSNGIQDGDETDVDCGGSKCGTKCENGKACSANSDCVNDLCENNICAGDPPANATADSVFINEVLSSPAKTIPFTLYSEGTQGDFVEIVNKLDKAQNLTGMNLHIQRTDSTSESAEVVLALNGIIPAKGAFLFFEKNVSFTPPPYVNFQISSEDNFFVETGSFEVWLSDIEGKASKKISYKAIRGAKSLNRKPDRDENAELVDHSTMSTYPASPGFCANGGAFHEDCFVFDICTDGKQDGNETDVDCGGSCATKCALGKKCASGDDCVTSACDGGVCVEKTCSSAKECGDGFDCVENKCALKATCSDGIKNQGETDVDCGGLYCGKCSSGQACLNNSDCMNFDCVNQQCSDAVYDKATENDIFINEVMGSPLAKGVFEIQNTTQCEFIEIVNKQEKTLDLTGISLEGIKNDAGTASISLGLEGVIPAKGAYVIGECDNIPMPSGSVYRKVAKIGITNDAKYDFYLLDGDKSFSPVIRVKNSSTGTVGKSQNRKPDNTDTDPQLVFHSELTTYKSSPGYCANGGRFIDDCVVVDTCTNGVKDGSESDVDCGGTCAKCQAGQSCSLAADCETDYCGTDGKCDIKPCESDAECGAGFRCVSGTCEAEPSCSDGIKNQDETDVDCGGPNCGKCSLNQHCQENTDCLSNQCTNDVCSGSDPKKAQLDKLFINEVMGSPKSSEAYDTQPSEKQNEYIEILNASDDKVMLDGLALVYLKCDSEDPSSCKEDKKPIPLEGLVDAKSFVVVSKESITLPDGCLNMVALPTSAITNDKYYNVYIKDIATDETSLNVMRNPNKTTGISQNRKNEMELQSVANEVLVLHNSLGDTCKKNNSPGYCVNGGIYKYNCEVDADCKPITK